MDVTPASRIAFEVKDKVSIEDLPEDLLLSIFKYHDHNTVLRMRLNKKMTQRIQSIFDSEQLWLKINEFDYQLLGRYWTKKYRKRDPFCVFNLQRKIRTWPECTVFRMIHISINVFDERIGDTIDQLFQASTERLVIDSNIQVALKQLNFANILQMTANIREVSIEAICSQLKGIELCIVWKSLIKGGCRMESFFVQLKPNLAKEFLKATFQISFEDHRNHSFKFTCSAAEQPKLYSDSAHYPRTLIHFAEDFVLQLDEHQISFAKIDADARTELLSKLREVKLNHLYSP